MFQDELKVRIDSINQEIEELLPKPRLYEDCLGDPLRYSMRGKGKRLRPLILEETYKMYGGSENDGKYLGIALEMIHNASLVHDDLPALDNDEFRRGIKTTHAEFGESIGILAGDGLLNYAYEVATTGLVESKTKDSYSKALSILANKGGIFGMLGGQTLDVAMTGKELDLKMIKFIHKGKTAALIQAAFACGACAAGASQEEIEKLMEIGLSVGIAFQIEDDILDVTSTSEVLGKPVKNDEKNHKTTYVTVKGVEGAKEDVKHLSQKAISVYDTLSAKNDFLRELILYLIERKK